MLVCFFLTYKQYILFGYACQVFFFVVKSSMKKIWKKPSKSLICGYCETCNRQLMSDEGGWIVTANKQYFCHDGKDGSCFDNYCVLELKKQKGE